MQTVECIEIRYGGGTRDGGPRYVGEVDRKGEVKNEREKSEMKRERDMEDGISNGADTERKRGKLGGGMRDEVIDIVRTMSSKWTMRSQVSGIGPAMRSEMWKMVRSCILSRRAEEDAMIWSQTRRLTFAMIEASELFGSYQE